MVVSMTDKHQVPDLNLTNADAVSQHVDMLKALAHPVRWRMMQLISMHADGVCVCDLEAQFTLSQPTISHHLRIMREAGVVVATQRGTWVYYAVAPSAIMQIRDAVTALVSIHV